MRSAILVLVGLLLVSGCAFDGSALWPKQEDAGVGGAADARAERATLRAERAGGAEAEVRRPLVRPLMIVAPDVDRAAYEPSLYNVVRDTLDRQPNALFDVVAVAPGAAAGATANSGSARSSSVERQADRVRDTLMALGLPPTRIATASQAAAPGADGEVRIYTRY